MKFCKYCGKQLDDNAVCDCQALQQNAQKEQAQKVTFTAPQQQAQQQTTFTAPQPQASPYAVNPNATPVGEGKFVKALKNIPVVFTAYWKNAKQTIDVAKKENDLIIAGMFTAIFFIGVLLANCCLYGSIDAGLGGYFHIFNFGKILVASLLVTVITAVLYVVIKLVSVKIFVKQADAKKVFFDAFIEFAIHSMPITILLLVAGFSAFISYYISLFLLVFAIVYLITALFAEIKSDVPAVSNNFLFILLVSAFVTIGLCVVLYVMINMLSWCTGLTEAMNAVGSFTSGISNFLS